ncbi:Hypothetical predicted protein, partial [Prunus dulcis]
GFAATRTEKSLAVGALKLGSQTEAIQAALRRDQICWRAWKMVVGVCGRCPRFLLPRFGVWSGRNLG